MVENVIPNLGVIPWEALKEIVVTLCAVVGAILGIYNCIQQRKSKKIQIALSVNYGRSIRKISISGDDRPYDCVLIEIANVSNRPTDINQIYLKVPFQKELFSFSDLKEINVDNLYDKKDFKTSNRELKGNERRHLETDITSFLVLLNIFDQKSKFKKLWIRLVKIGVQTSSGETFEKRPQKALRKKISTLVY